MTSVPVWRLARARHADLTGEGARRYGGRWNSPGRAAVYLSENAALPVLEVLVHLDLDPALLPDDYVLMHVDLAPLEGEDWAEDLPEIPAEPGECRRLGDAWLTAGRTPVLRVPSVIVPECRNLLLNPAHPAASRLAPPATRAFTFDRRLFPVAGSRLARI